MEQLTAILIEKYSPMWTNKQVWEFDQTHPNIKFDILFVKPKNGNKDWKSKNAHLNCDIRESIIANFDYLANGYELLISNGGKAGQSLDEKYTPYLMAVIVDMMIDDEITINFRMEGKCLSVSVNFDADVIDCKEFFEEFYHLATGVNYDIDTGIPEEETEAEIYLSRLQEEFDERMKAVLGDQYLPGNNDPDSINAK
ncbi:MAG: hypothetical protein K5785_02540 [Nitrosarchaeum sp.]|nr:hypothetical protein [Nitrosarchaeum sp.]